MSRHSGSAFSTCHLLREDRELAAGLSTQQRAHAEETCVTRALTVRRGRWKQPENAVGDGLTLLVLDGLLLRRVGVEGRFGAELLGPGDVVSPADSPQPRLHRVTAWRALESTRLAVLDDPVVEHMACYPQIMRRLLERSVERSRRLAVNMAIVHHPKVDTRLEMLFWHLADRWGRVRNGQTVLPLRLTHAVLADLIAAQRPTVSTALSALGSREIVRPAPEGWLLLAPPPEDALGSAKPTAAIPRRTSRRRDRGKDRALDQPHARTRSRRVRRAGQDVSARPG